MPPDPIATTSATTHRARIPRTVWVLGMVSLFMDMSSELVHAVLPIYLTTVLGLSVTTVGLIEGIAEATASMMKLISGTLSDRFASRKPLTLLGYGLAALTKPIFPLAETAFGVVVARFVDRVGKGIRGAPRDALVADVTPPEQRDAAYGLRQTLDTLGAVLGPLLAMGLLLWWGHRLRDVLWVATVPAVVCVALLAFGLEEPKQHAARTREASRFRWAALREFPPGFAALIVVSALFAVARLSEAFLVLRAQELHLPLPAIPLVMIVMSLAYASSSYPAGLLGAQRGRHGGLLAGMVLLIGAYAALAWSSPLGLWLGAALYGLHMGMTQGTLAAAVAESSPAALRATGFGIFHFVTGVFQLAGATFGGWLWTTHGSSWAFGLGALGAGAALVAIAGWAALSRR
ncbi:MAG TPA: MFS transporter [Albitalea sp.]|nr:MFS transporter [Albitalea sp.]